MKYAWLGLIFLLGCGVKVIQYINTDAPFGSYEEYVLIGLKGKNINNTDPSQDIRPRLETAIRGEMNRRNYIERSDEPDLIVRYEIVSGTVSQRNTNNGRIGMVPGMVPMYNLSTAVESVLLLEIISAKNQKLVWQASVDLRDHSKKTKRKDVLVSAVEKMFNTYLYEAGKKTPSANLDKS